MNAISIIIIILGVLFLAFELFQIFAKKGGGHRPGQ